VALERVAAHDQQARVLDHLDGGRARLVQDQRPLAEDVSGRELADDGPFGPGGPGLQPAGQDDVEGVGAVARVEDGGARLQQDLLADGEDLRTLFFRQPAEERDPRKLVEKLLAGFESQGFVSCSSAGAQPPEGPRRPGRGTEGRMRIAAPTALNRSSSRRCDDVRSYRITRRGL
jgi:hypothetical protein